MGTFSTEDSFLGLPGTTASNIWDEEIGLRRRRASIWLFFLFLLKIWINQKSFWLVNIRHLKETVLYFVGRVQLWVSRMWCHCAIVPSWLFRGPFILALHLLNYLCYYKPFICTKYIFSHLSSSVLGSVHS